MKIRIKGNSIRIRLSRTEVTDFGTQGYLEEHTEFGVDYFTYSLQRSGDVANLTAGLAGSKVTMYVPAEMADEWTTTEVVGYNHNMDIGEGKTLFLLLEKDFKCIDAPAYEDQSDNYEHPNLSCS